MKRVLSSLAAVLAGIALLAPVASGADRVYWANLGDGISFANQDGSGAGGNLDTTGATLNYPAGLTIDSTTGRAYWPNSGLGGGQPSISFVSLDGSGGGGDLNTSGALLEVPLGSAIDPVARRIYWANSGIFGGSQGISYANLDGSGGGNLNTPGVTPDQPVGVTIDPGARRIYWANSNSNSIAYANLDGSGGGILNTTGASVGNPSGLAVDPAAGRIYWSNASAGISFANLDGSGGGGILNTSGALTNFPIGVAIDSGAGRVYWANSDVGGGGVGPQRISYANLDNSGGGDLGTSGATVSLPNYPLLLHAPVSSGAPKLSGKSGHRARLSCTQGSWAADQSESKLFRAPHTFTYSWSRNGKKIHGANKSTYRAHAVGNYRCTVAGKNPAGETPQTSSPHANFGFGRLYRNKRRGQAKLIVKLPARGKLTLSGHKVKHRTRRPHLASKPKHLFKAALLIQAKGKAKRQLKRSGHTKLKLKVRFNPSKGTSGALTRTVTLRLRQSPPRTQGFPVGLGRAG